MRFDTRLVRVGQEADPETGDVVPAIHVATTYERREQDPPRYFYSRGENPTRERLERCLASLEDARYAAVFASGQAAAMTAASLLPAGKGIVCGEEVYGGTYDLFRLLGRSGTKVSYVDLTDPAARDSALASADVGMVWIETPSNPTLRVVDITEVCQRVADRDVLVVVDGTLAGPVLQQPLRLGAHVSLYSTTKFIAGHADVLGGVLVYDDPRLDSAVREYRTIAGNVPGPLDCFLVHRGVKTLSLRVERAVRNTLAVVELLRELPSVGVINYPGLPEHPQHAVAKAQMAQPGALVSFEYLGDAQQVLDRVELFTCAVSLGGVHSLIACPALMTHRTVPPPTRAALGISDSLIRLSVGIEDPFDLVQDLGAALGG